MYVFSSGQTEKPPPLLSAAYVDNSRRTATEKPPPQKRIKMSFSASADTDTPPPVVRAPDELKLVYKSYQKGDKYVMNSRIDLVDCAAPGGEGKRTRNFLRETTEGLPTDVQRTFSEFLGRDVEAGKEDGFAGDPEYGLEVNAVPGLTVFPGLLPPAIQRALLDRLLHRDLSNPDHPTNIHLHYTVPYPPPITSNQSHRQLASFFSPSAMNLVYRPKASHAPLTTHSFLSKKLRWLTLGAPYDWTTKTYPPPPHTPFPDDLKRLFHRLFPATIPDCAITSLYSPGDTLALHRDVSESAALQHPLVSVSLGCEAVFLAGLDGGQAKAHTRYAPIRVRSGDVIVLRGGARSAWHGVPKVLAGTCPGYLRRWPGPGVEYEAWEGWMEGKRVNFSLRQLFETDGHEDLGDTGVDGLG